MLYDDSRVFRPFLDHYSYLIFVVKFIVTKENLLAFISTKDQMGVVMGDLSQESLLLRFGSMPSLRWTGSEAK